MTYFGAFFNAACSALNAGIGAQGSNPGFSFGCAVLTGLASIGLFIMAAAESIQKTIRAQAAK